MGSLRSLDDGEAELLKHGYGPYLAALEVTRVQSLACRVFVRRSQQGFVWISPVMPNQLVAARRPIAVRSEEGRRTESVVLTDCSDDVFVVYVGS